MLLSINHLRDLQHVFMASMRIPPEQPASQSRSGDAAADVALRQEFDTFFVRYEGIISRYLWQMVGDQATATDLCQETFFRAWRHFPTIKDQPFARSWLYRVATNLAITHKRKQARYPQSPLDDLVPGASDPGKHIANRDLVMRALQTLPPKQRSILLLFEVNGHAINDIATMLGMSVSAVKMALHRAREQFRRE